MGSEMTEAPFHRVCSRSDVPEGTGRSFRIGSLQLVIFRSGGEFFASAAHCTHEKELLDEGFLDGATVECPRHGAQFDLRTGEALSLPATEPLEVFPVKLEGDDVLVAVPE